MGRLSGATIVSNYAADAQMVYAQETIFPEVGANPLFGEKGG